MRGLAVSIYFMVSTILGLGIGPYLVGVVSDASGGNLGFAIRSINWVAPGIVGLLVLLATRIRRDEATVLERARAAGEPV
jgi:MFS family permease